MFKKIIFVKITILAAMILSFGCGGSGGEDPSPEPIVNITGSPNELYNKGIEALKLGDISGANIYFESAIKVIGSSRSAPGTSPGSSAVALKADEPALDINAINTKSKIGRALTNIFLLLESAPVTEIFNALGQDQWKLNTIFGENGYLAKLYPIYNANNINIVAHTKLGQDLIFNDQEISAYKDTNLAPMYKTNLLKLNMRDTHLNVIGLNFVYGVEKVEGWDYSGDCITEEGAVLLTTMSCLFTKTETGEVDFFYYLIEPTARIDGKEYNQFGPAFYLEDAGEDMGTLVVDKLDTEYGGLNKITFNNLKLYDYNPSSGTEEYDYITINGSAEFALNSIPDAIPKDGFPFQNICSGLKCIISQVNSGYRSSKAIKSLTELSALLDSIIKDLEEASSDNVASFTIPKELFYATEDVLITHADVLGLLSAVYGAKTFINLLNSWSFDAGLSGIIGPNGDLIVDKEALVEELNKFFILKQDNELSQARENLADALEYGRQAIGELMTGVVGGLFEINDTNRTFYNELNKLFENLGGAMAGWSTLETTSPVINIDLDSFFNGGLDGAEIDYDAFVVNEDGDIEVIKYYFKDLFEKVIDYDVTKIRRYTFFAGGLYGVRDLSTILFPNLVNNKIGGRYFSFNGWYK